MNDQEYGEKYLWSSIAFEKWVKDQKKKMKEAGFRSSTAGVTHKLVMEVLIPNQIDLKFPKMVMNVKVKKRRKK